MNQVPLLDNNFVLLRETEELFSPLGMIHYHRYSKKEQIDEYLSQHADKIQAVVGKNHLPFGQAQCPELSDFADGVDTMQFLSEL